MPTDPAALKAWVASLSGDELMALTRQVAGGALTGHLGPLDGLGWQNRVIDLATPPDEPDLLTLTIELAGAKPRIWRRLSLPGDRALDGVHTLFQAAMGWTDSHLHRVQPGVGATYNQPYFVVDLQGSRGGHCCYEQGSPLWSHTSSRHPAGTHTEREPHRSHWWAAARRAARRAPGTESGRTPVLPTIV